MMEIKKKNRNHAKSNAADKQNQKSKFDIFLPHEYPMRTC